MAETRTEKYRRYRESLNEVKLNSKSEMGKEDRLSKTITDTSNSTSTLPLEEVLGKIENHEESVSTRVLTLKKIRIAVLIMIGILLIAGIIIFALIAFGGNN